MIKSKPWPGLMAWGFAFIVFVECASANMIIFPDDTPRTDTPAISPPEFMTARMALNEAVIDKEMAAELLSKADGAFQEGAFKHAAELLRRLAKMMPDQADILILSARAEIGLQNYPAAQALARRAAELDPEPTAPYKILGFCAMRESAWREAIEFYRTVTRMDPADASAYQAMGMLHRHMGEIPEAEALFRQAAEVDPGYYFSLSSLGNILVVQYEMEEAMRFLMMALQVDHSHARDWKNLLKAIEARVAAKDEHPDGVPPLDVEPHAWNYQRALGLVGTGRGAVAVGYFVKALEDELNKPKYHNDFGSTLAAMGRPRLAVPFLEAAIELDPDLVAAKQNLDQIRAALRQQDLGQALAEAKARVQAEPQQARHHYGLGVRYAEQGMLEEGTRSFIQAVKLAPDQKAYRIGLARALAKLGRVDYAIRQLDAVLALHPSDRDVLHRRTWLSLHRIKVSVADVHQAVTLLERLNKERGYRDLAFMQTLAFAYRMKGDVKNEASIREQLAKKMKR